MEIDSTDIEQFWHDRDEALAEVFGPHEANVWAGEYSMAFDGPPTVNEYRRQPGRVSYCTSELSNLVGPAMTLDMELVMVVRENSPLAEGKPPSAVRLLAHIGKFFVQEPVGPGHMLGPLAEPFAPFTRVLFLPFEQRPRIFVGKQRIRLVLCLGITDSERQYGTTHPSGELAAKLKEANILPFTDPLRPSVC